jgi:hypothetical protein
MALTHFGTVSRPATDTGTQNGPTATFGNPPIASMAAGDICTVFVSYRGNVSPIVVNDGGQTWTTHAEGIATGGVIIKFNVFTCKFNGTWSSAPAFGVSAGTSPLSATMQVARGADQTTWLDATPVRTEEGVADGTCELTEIVTVTANCLVYAFWTAEDNNQYGNFTAGFTPASNAAGNNQNRNSTTFGQASAYKAFAAAGGTGTINADQTAVGPDSWGGYVVAIRPAAGASLVFPSSHPMAHLLVR